MQINIRVSGVALLMVAVAIAAGWFFYDRHFQKSSVKTETTAETSEVPVVMRTPGGLLEIATVTAHERFTRSDYREFLGIDLGTTISQIQVTVIYRYHIEMEKEWPMSIQGKTCVIRAGPVKPTLPVAFDTTTMRKYAANGWARFNKNQNLASLERALTPELQTRAQSNRYLQLATDAGRKTVAEFVTNWLLKEQSWKRDPEYKVLVVFPGEPLPLSAR
ncbi:MAG: hypothetical protein Q8O37_12870 [Sulfuricellaceae bacterium]|nr:hypothetical protein [Sulfuricellaceae bacterium]